MALIDNIIAYYKFDTNNSTQPDSHGSNDGTVTGALYTASGKINGGYDFESTTRDMINVGNGLHASMRSTFSVSVWIKMESVPVSACIFSTYENAPYPLMLNIKSGRLQAWLNNDIQALSNTTLSTGTWYHVVITFDKDSGDGAELKYYVNGSYDGGSSYSIILGSSIDDSVIGRYSWNGGTGFYFDGVIDEMGIWSRAITPSEISIIYNSGDGLQYPFAVGGTISSIISTKGIHSAMYGGGICNG